MSLPRAVTVSVVIPCHNEADWIRDCVNSVIHQNGIQAEIIVVDDGSTDSTLEVITATLGGRHSVRVIRQSHQGVSRARNVGTALSSGAYVLYLDADDVLTAGTLVARVQALGESAADVAYCDWESWEQGLTNAVRSGVWAAALGDRPDCELLAGAWWPPGAFLFRRSLLGRLKMWNERLRVCQDLQFIVIAAASGATFVRVPQVGLRYRARAGSLSRMNNLSFLTECYQNACELQDMWTTGDQLDHDRVAVLLQTLRYLARVFGVDTRIRYDISGRITALDAVEKVLDEAARVPERRGRCRVLEP